MRKMRWVVILLCFLAIAVNYIDRANLAVAAPEIQKALGIGPAQMGFILSGFFWTYALMQMPFGWFVDRVGAHRVAARSRLVVAVHGGDGGREQRRRDVRLPADARRRRGGRVSVLREARQPMVQAVAARARDEHLR